MLTKARARTARTTITVLAGDRIVSTDHVHAAVPETAQSVPSTLAASSSPFSHPLFAVLSGSFNATAIPGNPPYVFDIPLRDAA